MSLVTLIYNRKKPATIDAIQLDATISENHQYQNEVTQFPIESGGEISDHIISRPDRLSMTGFVTNSPINYLGVAQNLIKGIGRTRVETAFAELLDLQKGKLVQPENVVRRHKLIKIVTGLTVYENMVLVSISFPRDGRTGETLRFNAEFQRIETATSQTVKIPETKAPAVEGGKPRQDNGRVTAPGANAATNTRMTSFAKTAADKFGVTTPGSGQ